MLKFIPSSECVYVTREDGTPFGQIHVNPIRFLPYTMDGIRLDQMREIVDAVDAANEKGGA